MKLDIIKEAIPKYIIEEIQEISGYLWEKGWAERNAGNFSINLNLDLTGLQDLSGLLSGWPSAHCKRIQDLSGFTDLKSLAGSSILVSKSGSRMRDIHKVPFNNLILMIIGNDASSCQLIDLGESVDGLPTSELPTHLAAHDMMIKNGLPEKVLLHCHLTEIIALTQIREFSDEMKLNNLLWSMHPETIIFIPEGIGWIPFTIPGTPQTAEQTVRKFHQHKILCWEKHGCLSIGRNLPEAFDLMDIAAKSAKIYLSVKAAGYTPEGIRDEDLAEIRKLLIS